MLPRSETWLKRQFAIANTKKDNMALGVGDCGAAK